MSSNKFIAAWCPIATPRRRNERCRARYRKFPKTSTFQNLKLTFEFGVAYRVDFPPNAAFADALGYATALEVAIDMVEGDVNQRITDELEQVHRSVVPDRDTAQAK